VKNQFVSLITKVFTGFFQTLGSAIMSTMKPKTQAKNQQPAAAKPAAAAQPKKDQKAPKKK